LLVLHPSVATSVENNNSGCHEAIEAADRPNRTNQSSNGGSGYGIEYESSNTETTQTGKLS
jgi:hypothetical protein